LGEFRKVNDSIRRLRRSAMGPGAPEFTGGSGKIGAIEAAKSSPVNVVGDRSSGRPAEYRTRG
jgi:hypothetical protein